MVINLNNNNLDQKKMNNIKNSINNGNINEAISQISPEMLENFSKILSQNNNNNNSDNNNNNLNNIDINTVMKLASSIKSSSKNDPRNNLLNALKPYMRDSKKEKMDNYINMIDMAKIASLLNNKGNK